MCGSAPLLARETFAGFQAERWWRQIVQSVVLASAERFRGREPLEPSRLAADLAPCLVREVDHREPRGRVFLVYAGDALTVAVADQKRREILEARVVADHEKRARLGLDL